MRNTKSMRIYVLIFLQQGVEALQGKSVCDHIQTVVNQLEDVDVLSTSAPSELDESLLNYPEFWETTTSVQSSLGEDIEYDIYRQCRKTAKFIQHLHTAKIIIIIDKIL